jgi:hypothetical protein
MYSVVCPADSTTNQAGGSFPLTIKPITIPTYWGIGTLLNIINTAWSDDSGKLNVFMRHLASSVTYLNFGVCTVS